DVAARCGSPYSKRYVTNVAVRLKPRPEFVQQVIVVCRQWNIYDGIAAKSEWPRCEVVHLIGNYQGADDHNLRNEELQHDQQAPHKGSSPLCCDLVLEYGRRIESGENHRRIKSREQRCRPDE